MTSSSSADVVHWLGLERAYGPGLDRGSNCIRQSDPFGGHFAVYPARLLILKLVRGIQTKLGVASVVIVAVILRHSWLPL
jgi:hypothetical protein